MTAGPGLAARGFAVPAADKDDGPLTGTTPEPAVKP